MDGPLIPRFTTTSGASNIPCPTIAIPDFNPVSGDISTAIVFRRFPSNLSKVLTPIRDSRFADSAWWIKWILSNDFIFSL